MQSMCFLKKERAKSGHESIYKLVKSLFPFLCIPSFVSHVFLPKAGMYNWEGMFVRVFLGGRAESNVHGFRF